MFARVIILSVGLILGAAFIAGASKTEQVPSRRPLSEFPLEVGSWRGQNAEPFAPDILAVLGVDDYISRVYQSGGAYSSLYIGYYQSQRQGDTMHSPLNCLPGAGWEPVSKSYLSIPVTSADTPGEHTISINSYVIRKGLDQQVVLYWYQGHGRVTANEYRSKLFMIYDAVRLNRTDAAMVRVISPIRSAPDAEPAAIAHAVDFVKAMFPLLDQYLPS